MNIIKIWTLAYLDKPVRFNGSMRVKGSPIRSPRVKRKGVPIMQIADAYFFSFAWKVVYRYADWFSLSWCRIRLNGNALVTHLDQGREKNSLQRPLDSSSLTEGIFRFHLFTSQIFIICQTRWRGFSFDL